MQREEHADWLLEQVGEGPREVIALEVSGVDRGSLAPRLTEKLAQVARSDDVEVGEPIRRQAQERARAAACGVGAEVYALIAEEAFEYLDGPVTPKPVAI